jgi:hypothetical protein
MVNLSSQVAQDQTVTCRLAVRRNIHLAIGRGDATQNF